MNKSDQLWMFYVMSFVVATCIAIALKAMGSPWFPLAFLCVAVATINMVLFLLNPLMVTEDV